MNYLTNNVFKSKDNIAYHLTTAKDVITLNHGQIELLEEKINKLESAAVESAKGVSITVIEKEQSFAIIGFIENLLKDFKTDQEIVDSEIIDFTQHATERINDYEICIERDWDYEKVEHEIAECLRRAYNVEQIRIRFDPITKKSYKHFGFTIRGFLNKDGEKYKDAQLVIYFEEDPVDHDQTIMIITILTPDF